jgi:hypothetical protein
MGAGAVIYMQTNAGIPALLRRASQHADRSEIAVISSKQGKCLKGVKARHGPKRSQPRN